MSHITKMPSGEVAAMLLALAGVWAEKGSLEFLPALRIVAFSKSLHIWQILEHLIV